jgi:hypothetical protein
MPWLVFGNFNEILDPSEKTGRIERRRQQMDGFRQVISDCALCDMEYQGKRFTWWNGRYNAECVYERLDRGLCSADWTVLFPNAKFHHLPFTNSDHDAILIRLNLRLAPSHRKPKLFRFENAWLQTEGLEDVIRVACNEPQSGYLMYQVTQRIKACRVALLQWSKAKSRPTAKQIEKMNNLIGDLERRCQEEPGERVLINRRAAAHRELNVLLAQNETYWHQQSRISWLREGDRNTKSFHATASHRRQKNVKRFKRNGWTDF